MRSFLSMLFFGFLLTLMMSLQNGVVVDARIHASGDAAAIPVKRQERHERSPSVGNLLHAGNSHRSLGASDATATLSTIRNLAQQQSWARDDDGKILWWIWLIIGLSCGFFCFVCCCASACCLRD